MDWFGRIEYDTVQCHHTMDTVPDPAAFPPHTHTEMELLYFISGRANCLVEGHIYTLQPGDLLIMRTGETHSMQPATDVPYERVAIHFSTQLLMPELQKTLLPPFTDRALGTGNLYTAGELPGDFIKQCMQLLFEHAPDDGPQRVIVYLLPLLQQITDAWQKREGNQPPVPEQQISAQLVTYINLHLSELSSLQQLEQRFFLSQSQISRIFRRTTGTSVWEYVQIKRLFAARELLYQGVSPGQAATSSGYREYSTFFRAYKKQFGHSPLEDTQRAAATHIG